tara:strand:+ start:4260 stop:5168 length:909 start_codon:yes stop_codon:yes gene_type:complete
MRYLLPVFALMTLFSMTIPNGSELEMNLKRRPAQVTPEEDQSVVLNGTLTLENQEEVARVLFMLSRNISDEFAVGDGLSMVMYVLRYMAQIGEYEFVQRDMKALIASFENLLGEPFDPEVWSVVEQIRKLQFARHKGQLSVKIFAMNEETGVTVMMNAPGEPGSALKEIEFVRLKHGSRVSFSDAESSKDHAHVKDLVKDRFKILGFIGLVEDDMNLIHPSLVDAIDLHLRREKDDLIKPLFIDFDDAFVRVHTSTILKTIDFKFKEGVCIPGVKTIEGTSAPSFLLTAKAGLLKLKTTVDQ